MKKSEIKSFLDEKAALYNQPTFIESDPIQIPHLFSLKEDIEIAGFLTATISWGNRKMIIQNAHKLMALMDNTPFEFVMSHTETDLERFQNFIHRTFNSVDSTAFIKGLQHIYQNHQGIENVFAQHQDADGLQKSIHEFKKLFFNSDIGIPF